MCILKQYGGFPQVIAAWHHIPKPYWFCGLGFWLPFLKCLKLGLLLASCLLRFAFCSLWKTLLDGMVAVTTALLMDTMTIAWMGLGTLIVVPLAMTEVVVATSVEIGVVIPSVNPYITQVRTCIPLVEYLICKHFVLSSKMFILLFSKNIRFSTVKGYFEFVS